jgi:2,3-bisphosphoglycerate-dependent phosphoglycerate mutase
MKAPSEMTIEEKIEYYYDLFQQAGEEYTRDAVKDAVELLSYKGKGAPAKLPKEESDEFPTLYIFRHGESFDNTNFLFSGWRDPELTEKGREQALELAPKLATKNIGMLIASTQKRAIETLRLAVSKNPTAKKLEIITDERIRERNYGDYQGKSKIEIQMREGAERLHKIRRSFDTPPPNGESIKMVCARVAEFCESWIPRIKAGGINVAIACSGNSIRGFRRYFEPEITNEQIATMETSLGKDYLAYVLR